MTNGQWLRNLDNKEIAELISNHSSCDFCSYKGEKCIHDIRLLGCENGIFEWLNAEHENPMPEIRIGDILRFKLGNYDEVYTATVIAEGCILLIVVMGYLVLVIVIIRLLKCNDLMMKF